MLKSKNIEQNFFNKFITVLSRKGCKAKAIKIVTLAFLKLQRSQQKPLSLLLIKAWKKLDVFVEARKICIRRNFYLVPFTVSVQRRILLALKWIIQTAVSNKKKESLSDKLYNEILLLNTEGAESNAIKLKTLNNESAQANRSNMHYRW